ncbi:Restriction enzyme BgcI subunit beta [subsurface metagenome]
MKDYKTVSICHLFDVSYGTKFDLKRMQITSADDPDAISFVSRSRQNLGVVAYVKPYRGTEPLAAGLITVALGGSYLLSAFVQENLFYTAQNVAVLSPKKEMTENEKLFYCVCLGKNRFKYSAFGREANRTLSTLQVPAKMPEEFGRISVDDAVPSTSKTPNISFELSTTDWQYFKLTDLFCISGTGTTSLVELEKYGHGVYPYVTTRATNNGVEGFYNHFTEVGNALVIDSAVLGYCSYQEKNFSASDHVEKLTPKFDINRYIALFLTTVLNLEQYRYSYGRKASQSRLKRTRIKLPSKNTKPDWQFMEDYIKSLPYSSNL